MAESPFRGTARLHVMCHGHRPGEMWNSETSLGPLAYVTGEQTPRMWRRCLGIGPPGRRLLRRQHVFLTPGTYSIGVIAFEGEGIRSQP